MGIWSGNCAVADGWKTDGLTVMITLRSTESSSSICHLQSANLRCHEHACGAEEPVIQGVALLQNLYDGVGGRPWRADLSHGFVQSRIKFAILRWYGLNALPFE